MVPTDFYHYRRACLPAPPKTNHPSDELALLIIHVIDINNPPFLLKVLQYVSHNALPSPRATQS